MGIQQPHARHYGGVRKREINTLFLGGANRLFQPLLRYSTNCVRIESDVMTILRMTNLNLRGKRVFIRADLNVPQDKSGHITDDTRIRASVPGIRMALDAGAAVMVTSHLGRPVEGQCKPEDSLAPVAQRLRFRYGLKMRYRRGISRLPKRELDFIRTTC